MSNTCYNCFREKPANTPVCPYCGHNETSEGDRPLALPHGSILNNRYIVGRVLGQGGFGITYLAQDYSTKQLVAIKEYMPHSMAMRRPGNAVTAYSGYHGENFKYGKECFIQEAKTLSTFVGNPNIVRIHSYFEENNTAYLVMEYVPGMTFQEYIKRRGGRISWQDAHRILLPVVSALGAVHSRGLIHRDLTPDNLIIANNGTVKIIDFGAARYSLGDQTHSLSVILKHGFAPQEQYARHGKQGPYTDVYSLAATYYFAVTGKLPPDSIDRIYDDNIRPIRAHGVNIPVGVENALMKALSVQAQDRYQYMEQFRVALEQGENPPPQTVTNNPSTTRGTVEPPTIGNSALQPVTAPQKRKSSGAAIALGVGIPFFLIMIVLVVVLATSGNHSDNRTANNENSFSLFGQQDNTETTVPETPTPTPIDFVDMAYHPILATGYTHVVGLQSNGTVLASGDEGAAQCDVSELKDIEAVAAGYYHTVCLKSDGTVIAAGYDGYGQCDVEDWSDIIQISAGANTTAGLRRDGTVVAVGNNEDGQCDVSAWRDIVSISVGSHHIVGLKRDGTVVAAGSNVSGQCNIGNWTDIVAISAGGWHTVGLKSNGMVVAVGLNTVNQCEVSAWRNIIAIDAGWDHTIALKQDGTVASVGYNDDGQCEVSTWRDIIAIVAENNDTLAVKADGTVLSVGENDHSTCDVSTWTLKH